MHINICLSIILANLLFSSILANEPSSNNIPQQCMIDCQTDYGVELGVSPKGIPAYSNCNSNCVVFEPNHYDEIYTGIKWQCVEYARRWLLHEYGVVYGDVDIASDIWALSEVSNPISKQSFKFDSIVNGAARAPQRGDLLIYSKEFLGTGHVAVVVALNEEEKTISVAEQNFTNSHWKEKYARKIEYVIRDDQIWLLDSYLVGWKRVLKI